MSPDFPSAVLDALIPGGAALPPASRAGLDPAAYAGPHRDAFQAIAEAAGGEAAFLAASPAARIAALRRVEAGPPAPAFKALVAAALQDYCESDHVVRALGWRPGPPQPAGHPLAPTDEATWRRLDRVRARGRLWR